MNERGKKTALTQPLANIFAEVDRLAGAMLICSVLISLPYTSIWTRYLYLVAFNFFFYNSFT